MANPGERHRCTGGGWCSGIAPASLSATSLASMRLILSAAIVSALVTGIVADDACEALNSSADAEYWCVVAAAFQCCHCVLGSLTLDSCFVCWLPGRPWQSAPRALPRNPAGSACRRCAARQVMKKDRQMGTRAQSGCLHQTRAPSFQPAQTSKAANRAPQLLTVHGAHRNRRA